MIFFRVRLGSRRECGIRNWDGFIDVFVMDRDDKMAKRELFVSCSNILR